MRIELSQQRALLRHVVVALKELAMHVVAARTLPRTVGPFPGESLLSVLLRLSWRLRLSPAEVCGRLGVPLSDKRIPAALTVAAQPTVAAHLAGAGGWSVSEVLAATVAGALPGLGLTVDCLDGPASAQVLSHWAGPYTGRFCPLCLAEPSPYWRTCWSTPWHFMCLQHEVLLDERCPTCAVAVAPGRRAGILRRPGAILPPHACRSLGSGSGHPAACQQPLSAAPAVRVDAAAVSAQAWISTTLRSCATGALAPSLAQVQAVTALLRLGSGTPRRRGPQWLLPAATALQAMEELTAAHAYMTGGDGNRGSTTLAYDRGACRSLTSLRPSLVARGLSADRLSPRAPAGVLLPAQRTPHDVESALRELPQLLPPPETQELLQRLGTTLDGAPSLRLMRREAISALGRLLGAHAVHDVALAVGASPAMHDAASRAVRRWLTALDLERPWREGVSDFLNRWEPVPQVRYGLRRAALRDDDGLLQSVVSTALSMETSAAHLSGFVPAAQLYVWTVATSGDHLLAPQWHQSAPQGPPVARVRERYRKIVRGEHGGLSDRLDAAADQLVAVLERRAATGSAVGALPSEAAP